MEQTTLTRLEDFHKDQYDAFWGIEPHWDLEVVKHFAESSTNAISPAAFSIELPDIISAKTPGQNDNASTHTLQAYMQHCTTLCHNTFSHIEASMTTIAQKCDLLQGSYGPLSGQDGLARLLKTEIATTQVQTVTHHTRILGESVFNEIDVVFQRWNDFQTFVENFRQLLGSELDVIPKKRQLHADLWKELEKSKDKNEQIRQAFSKSLTAMQNSATLVAIFRDGMTKHALDQAAAVFASAERELDEKVEALRKQEQKLLHQNRNPIQSNATLAELSKARDALDLIEIQMNSKLKEVEIEEEIIRERRSKKAAEVGYVTMVYNMWYGEDPGRKATENAIRAKEDERLEALNEECRNLQRRYKLGKATQDSCQSCCDSRSKERETLEEKLKEIQKDIHQNCDNVVKLRHNLKAISNQVAAYNSLKSQQRDLQKQLEQLKYNEMEMTMRASIIVEFQKYMDALWDACPKVSNRFANLRQQISTNGEVGLKMYGLLSTFDANVQIRHTLMPHELEKYIQRHVEICIELAITFSVIRDFVKFYRDICRGVTAPALHSSVLMKYDYPVQGFPRASSTLEPSDLHRRKVLATDESSRLALGRPGGRIVEVEDDRQIDHNIRGPMFDHHQYQQQSMGLIAKSSNPVKRALAQSYSQAKNMPMQQRRLIIEAICSSAMGVKICFMTQTRVYPQIQTQTMAQSQIKKQTQTQNVQSQFPAQLPPRPQKTNGVKNVLKRIGAGARKSVDNDSDINTPPTSTAGVIVDPRPHGLQRYELDNSGQLAMYRKPVTAVRR